MKYRVVMTGTAMVSTGVSIEADSKEEAENKALEMADRGDVVWEYQGLVEDNRIEAEVIQGGQNA
jgi:hypothetical protein